MNILIYNKGQVFCPQCASSDIKHDYKRCESYCNDCGLVCIDNNFINGAGVKLYEIEIMRLKSILAHQNKIAGK